MRTRSRSWMKNMVARGVGEGSRREGCVSAPAERSLGPALPFRRARDSYRAQLLAMCFPAWMNPEMVGLMGRDGWYCIAAPQACLYSGNE